MYRPRWGTEEGRREAGWSGQAPRRQRRGRGRHKGGSPAERNRAGSEPWGGGGRRVRVRARGFAFPAAEGAWRCGPARRSRPRGRREKRRGGELERRPLPRLPGSGGGGAGGGERRRRGRAGGQGAPRAGTGHRASVPAPGQRGSRHAGSSSAPGGQPRPGRRASPERNSCRRGGPGPRGHEPARHSRRGTRDPRRCGAGAAAGKSWGGQSQNGPGGKCGCTADTRGAEGRGDKGVWAGGRRRGSSAGGEKGVRSDSRAGAGKCPAGTPRVRREGGPRGAATGGTGGEWVVG